MYEARHGTLVANIVTTVTLTLGHDEVEVLNRDGAAELYFTVDQSDPTVGGLDCYVLPAAISAQTVKSPSQASPSVVRLIAAAATKYSVMAVQR